MRGLSSLIDLEMHSKANVHKTIVALCHDALWENPGFRMQ